MKDPNGMIYPPSHLIRAQVARVLHRPYSTVCLMVKTGRLKSETWHGTVMIPMSAVMEVLAQDEIKRGTTDPKNYPG